MSEILSQSEIDALLSALTNGEINAEDIRDNEQTTRIRNYDFRRAMRFSKDHIRIISRIHEHFSRLMTTHLSGQLRSIVQIQVESVDQVPYEEFIHSIPPLTVIEVMEFSPLEGKVVVEMNPQIVFAMLDRLMGGAVKGPYKERELTEIETALITRILRNMGSFFAEAWRNVEDLKPRFVSMESNPQFLQLTTPNETVLVVTLSAKIGNASGLLNVCIPHVTIEPLLPKLSTQYFMDVAKSKRTTEIDEQRLIGHLKRVDVQAIVQLGFTELSFADVLDLQVGDVIPLHAPISNPVTILIDELPIFHASVGRHRDRYAVKVIEDLKEVGDDERQYKIDTGRN